jgi:ribosomal protein S6E (S10)
VGLTCRDKDLHKLASWLNLTFECKKTGERKKKKARGKNEER